MRWISEGVWAVRHAPLFCMLAIMGMLWFPASVSAQAAPSQRGPENPTSTPAVSSSATGAMAVARNSAASAKPAPPTLSQPDASSHPTDLSPPSTESRFMIVLDAAHGGTDPGALLGADGPEKNYTLAFALRLHTLLNARGIRSTLTRTGDVALDSDARAAIANRAHAAACILLHATASGNGVHLFTSSLASATPGPQDTRRAFLPWRTAQASYATESLRLESDINTALAREHVPALLGRTSLMPLDSMACPAVAIEVAPPDAATPLNDSAYQQQIAGSLASALTAWRTDWRQQP